PHLKDLYAKYKDEGFEILGVALEQREDLEANKKSWTEAIEKYDLPWLQVLNNDGEENYNVVEAYGVSAFPTQVRIDKEGKINFRNVGGGQETLNQKLEEIFGS